MPRDYCRFFVDAESLLQSTNQHNVPYLCVHNTTHLLRLQVHQCTPFQLILGIFFCAHLSRSFDRYQCLDKKRKKTQLSFAPCCWICEGQVRLLQWFSVVWGMAKRKNCAFLLWINWFEMGNCGMHGRSRLTGDDGVKNSKIVFSSCLRTHSFGPLKITSPWTTPSLSVLAVGRNTTTTFRE